MLNYVPHNFYTFQVGFHGTATVLCKLSMKQLVNLPGTQPLINETLFTVAKYLFPFQRYSSFEICNLPSNDVINSTKYSNSRKKWKFHANEA